MMQIEVTWDCGRPEYWVVPAGDWDGTYILAGPFSRRWDAQTWIDENPNAAAYNNSHLLTTS